MTSRTGMMAARRRRSAGHTLVELLLVVVLLGVLLAVAIPRFRSSLDGAEAQQVVDRLNTILWTAQSHARTRGVPTAVTLDRRAARIVLEDVPGTDASAAGTSYATWETEREAQLIAAWPLPASLDIRPETIHFHPDGTCDPAKVVIDPAGDAQVFTVRPSRPQLTADPR